MAKVEKYIDAQGELLDFAKKNDIFYLDTSAKTNLNVMKSINLLIDSKIISFGF